MEVDFADLKNWQRVVWVWGNSSLQYLDMSSFGINWILGFWQLEYLEELKLIDNPNFNQASLRILNTYHLSRLSHLDVQSASLDTFKFSKLLRKMRGSRLTALKIDWNVIKQVLLRIHDRMPKLEMFSATQNQLLSTTELTAKLLTLRHQTFYISVDRTTLLVKNYHKNKRVVPFVNHICYTKSGFTCPIEFPQNLTHLDLSYSAFQLATILSLALLANNSLKFVHLSYNSVQILPKPFYCAKNINLAITMLDLSNNRIKCINSSYFSHYNWSSLNVLNLEQI